MNILYIGDIMAAPGVGAVKSMLSELQKKYRFDLVIAQAENVTNGKGMSVADMQKLQDLGIDFFTGGNHTPVLKELHPLLEDSGEPVIGPANMTACPGPGWKFTETAAGRVLIISLLGSTVGREVLSSNPLQSVDKILAINQDEERAATIVNFHGDYSSEKRIIGYYLDGRVTAVIGDHWHVPTADAMVLPKGTAHITDVGMCGSLHSSLGVELESVVPRWRDDVLTTNQLALAPPYQFNAVIIETNADGLAEKITPVNEIIK